MIFHLYFKYECMYLTNFGFTYVDVYKYLKENIPKFIREFHHIIQLIVFIFHTPPLKPIENYFSGVILF